MEELRRARNKVVGSKQTLRHLARGDVVRLYVAQDAEERVVREVLERARAAGVEIVYVESMRELGRACGIHVGAAAAALLKSGPSTEEE